MYNTKMLKD